MQGIGFMNVREELFVYPAYNSRLESSDLELRYWERPAGADSSWIVGKRRWSFDEEWYYRLDSCWGREVKPSRSNCASELFVSSIRMAVSKIFCQKISPMVSNIADDGVSVRSEWVGGWLSTEDETWKYPSCREIIANAWMTFNGCRSECTRSWSWFQMSRDLYLKIHWRITIFFLLSPVSIFRELYAYTSMTTHNHYSSMNSSTVLEIYYFPVKDLKKNLQNASTRKYLSSDELWNAVWSPFWVTVHLRTYFNNCDYINK